MGFRLYREVIDHAPPDITSGELVVWLVIADDANDDTRVGWLDGDELCRRARMKPRGVASALQRLAARGYELRVARGVDKNGRPVYAYRGTQTTYRLPVLDGERSRHDVTIDGERSRHSVERSRHSVGKVTPQRDPSPQAPQHPQQRAARFVVEHTNATEAEAAAAVALIEREKQPRSLAAFVARLAGDGELPGWVDRVRADGRRSALADWLAGLAELPACPHDVPGGDRLRPDTGRPQCALCRAQEAHLPAVTRAAG